MPEQEPTTDELTKEQYWKAVMWGIQNHHLKVRPDKEVKAASSETANETARVLESSDRE